MRRAVITSGLFLFSFLLPVLAGGTASAATPLPAGGQFYQYEPGPSPVIQSGAATARPVGTGSSATGGENLRMDVGLDAFDSPVDVYIALYLPALSPEVWLFTPNGLQAVSQGLVPWRSGVAGPTSETIFGDIAVSALPAGAYSFLVLVTPTGSLESYYLWQTTVNLYTLTIDKFGDGLVKSDVGGIDCGGTCTSTYAKGASVSLTALPDEGKKFLSWSGCDSAFAETCRAVMNGNLSVGPSFGSELVIEDNVRILNEESMQYLVTQEGTTYSFSNDCAELYNVTSGDILVMENESETSVREVVNVSPEGSVLKLETGEASLPDVVREGTMHYSGGEMGEPIPDEETVSATSAASHGIRLRIGLQPDGTGITAAVTGQVAGDHRAVDAIEMPAITISDKVKITGSLDLLFPKDASISLTICDLGDCRDGLPVDSFRAVFYVTPVLDFNVEVLKPFSAAEGELEKSVTPLPIRLANIPLAPGIFVTAKLDVTIGVSGRAEEALSFGSRLEIPLKIGMKYIAGEGWTIYPDEPISLIARPSPSHVSAGSHNVRAYVEPAFGLLLADTFGPTFRLKASLGSQQALLPTDPGSASTNLYQWSLTAGLDAQYDILLDDWFDTGKKEWDLGRILYQEIDGKTFGSTVAVAGVAGPVSPVFSGPVLLFGKENYNYRNLPVTSRTVNFTAKGMTCDPGCGEAEMVSYEWDFGDGTTGTGKAPSHTYLEGIYTVRLTVKDSAGREDSSSLRVIVDETGPSRPSNVKIAEKALNILQLNWDASSDNLGVAGYLLYLDGREILSTDLTSATAVRPLSPGSHCYRVSSVDKAGNESALSDASCIDNAVSDADRGVKINLTAKPVASTRISLNWTNLETRGLEYRVYRGTKLISTGPENSFLDTGLRPSTGYCYYIGAVSLIGTTEVQISNSNIVCVTTSATLDTAPPSVPTGLIVSVDSTGVLTHINVSWNASWDNVGVTGYEVYHDGVFYKKVTGTSLTVADLPESGQYCFQISALDAAGNRSALSSQACTSGTSCIYSISPTGESVGMSGGSYSIAVTAPSGCVWIAASNNNWIAVASGSSGNGNGTVNYTVSANSGSSRTGSITVAGKIFSVMQDGGGSYETASPMNLSLSSIRYD